MMNECSSAQGQEWAAVICLWCVPGIYVESTYADIRAITFCKAVDDYSLV